MYRNKGEFKESRFMDARIETTRFRVEGMDCASCASKVDTAARRTEGVKDVSVSVVAGTMSVQHDPDADLTELALRFSNLGYPARPIPSPSARAVASTGDHDDDHRDGDDHAGGDHLHMHGD